MMTPETLKVNDILSFQLPDISLHLEITILGAEMNIDNQHHLYISLLLREHHLDIALRCYYDLGTATDAKTANQILEGKKKQTQKKPSCTTAET
jgi:hypothetical protein